MNTSQARQEEILIVGAGIIGLALAYELQQRGRTVLVLERHRPGAGATQAAGGMLAPISEAEVGDDRIVRFGLESLALYPDFVEQLERESGVECRLLTDGTLWIAVTRDDREELDHVERTLRLRNLPVRRLSADEVASREPHLSGRARAGMLVEGDLQVDPRRLTDALVRVVEHGGGRVLGGADVSQIDPVEGGLVVRGRSSDGDRFELHRTTVVMAAGAWNERELRNPLGSAGIRPIKGQLLRLRGPRLLRHVVRTPDVYLIPRADGELLVGATMEEMGYDRQPTAGAAMDLLRHAWEALPGIYDLDFVEHCVGLRAATEDHLPLIGPSEVPGLWLAAAHYRHGILFAPGVARWLAKQIVDGDCPEPLVPFQRDRGIGAAPSSTETAWTRDRA